MHLSYTCQHGVDSSVHRASACVVLTDELQSVDQSCARHNGSAVLVIMEHWNIHTPLRLLFYVEALRSLQANKAQQARSCHDLFKQPGHNRASNLLL